MTILKPELIGKSYPPQTLKVEAQAIKKYALATNDENPSYLDESRPGGIIAPPLFAVVPAFPFLQQLLLDPDVQLPMDRTLHGEQDMWFASPIRPSDTLVTSGKIVAAEETSTGHTVTFEVTSRTAEGEERVRQHLIAFIRDPAKRGLRPTQEARQPAEPVAVATMRVTEDQTYRYAEASGDQNPPHVNEAFAKAIGFRTVILQGLCTLAFAQKAVIDNVAGGDPTRLKHLKARFAKVVYPGDVLTTRIWAEGAGEGAGLFSFETANQEGELVIRNGLAEVGL